jgi:hypothetical protein
VIRRTRTLGLVEAVGECFPEAARAKAAAVQKHRIDRERQRMYPRRQVVTGIEWPLVA